MKANSRHARVDTWVRGVFTLATVSLVALVATACSSSGFADENVGSVSQTVCTVPGGMAVLATPAAPQVQGTVVTLSTPLATCAAGETAQYRFVYQRDGTAPLVLVRDWAASSTATWNTTGLPDGKYNIIAYARNAGATNVQGSARGVYTLGNVCRTAGLTVSPTGLIAAGTPVSLTGSCTGAASAEYRFAYKGAKQTAYTLIRDYGASTVSWDTTGLPEDSYDVIVYTRAAGNTSVNEAAAHATVLVGSQGCGNLAVSASPPGPQPNGTTVALTATSSCSGGGAPEYQFIYKAPGATAFSVIRGWGTASVNWVTPPADTFSSGTYTVAAQVRHVGSTGPAEATRYLNYQLGSVCTSVALAVSPAGPQPVGSVLTLTASATCTAGTRPMYQFSYRAPGATAFTPIGGPSETPTANWVTIPVTAGVVTLRVEAEGRLNLSAADTTASKTYTLLNAGTSCVAQWPPRGTYLLDLTTTQQDCSDREPYDCSPITTQSGKTAMRIDESSFGPQYSTVTIWPSSNVRLRSAPAPEQDVFGGYFDPASTDVVYHVESFIECLDYLGGGPGYGSVSFDIERATGNITNFTRSCRDQYLTFHNVTTNVGSGHLICP